MNVLLGLPTDLACVVLSEWLMLEHVARLDSAFANTKARPIFLESVLRSPCCVVRFPLYQIDDSLPMKWLIRRGLRVGRLLTSTYTMNTCLIYTKIFGQSILSVEIHAFNLRSSAAKVFINAVSSNCNNLTSMVCVSCDVNASIFNVLRYCSKLESFLLVDCFDECNNTFPVCDSLSSVATQLKDLAIDIWWRNHLSFLSAISAIQRYISLPHIQRLYVSNSNTQENDSPISTLAIWNECGERLRCLGYKGLSSATIRDLTEFIVSHPSILYLDVSFSSKWTDASTEAAVRHLPQLEQLNLSETAITDTSLLSVAEFCRSTLKGLFVSECVNVTGNGVNEVLAHCSKLQTLGIDFMPHVTNSINSQLVGNIRTLQSRWVARNKANSMFKYFHRLENMYIEQYYPSERCGPLILCTDILPLLRKLLLCASASSYYRDASIDACSSVWVRKQNEKALAALHSQRPHLHIRYEVATYWPSNLMHLPL